MWPSRPRTTAGVLLGHAWLRMCWLCRYVDWQSCGPGLRQAYGGRGPHNGEPCGIPVSTAAEVAMLEPLHMACVPAPGSLLACQPLCSHLRQELID